MKRSYEIDMCNGPLFSRLLLFALPLMLSGILQLLFNAADIVVVGQFAGSNAMAAVGSTSSLINLLVNLFIGISVGANVLVARYYGSRSPEDVEQTVHTALITGFIGAFKAYSDAVALFGTDLNAAGMNTIVGYVYDMLYGSSGGYPSYASAAAIVLFVIVLTITCINLLVSRRQHWT